MDISNKQRWEIAQQFELHEWTSIPNVVSAEVEEGTRKFGHRFQNLSEQLKLDSNSKLLEIGCGPTAPVKLFPAGQKFGVDPLAKKLGYEGVKDNLTVIASEGENLPFDNEFFDVVICINVIDHTKNPSEVLKEAKRVLKPSGTLVLCCYTYSPFITFIKIFSEKTGIFRNVAHPFTFTPKSLQNLVKQAGFDAKDVEIIHEGMGPWDYGKTNAVTVTNALITNIILFFNFKIFREKFFVREVLITAKLH